MRETSSSSSIRRACRVALRWIASIAACSAGFVEGLAAQHRRPSKHRAQRRPELVRHDREKVVLGSVRRLGIGSGALRALVEAGAIDRLRGVVRDRGEQRTVSLIEIDRRGEMKREHAHRRTFDEQRQRGNRREPAVRRHRRRARVLLLPFGEGADEHRPARVDRRRRAEAGFGGKAVRHLDELARVLLGIKRFEMRVVAEQRDRARRRAGDHLALADDHLGDRLERDRLR